LQLSGSRIPMPQIVMELPPELATRSRIFRFSGWISALRCLA
jgi:hypothetical protein